MSRHTTRVALFLCAWIFSLASGVPLAENGTQCFVNEVEGQSNVETCGNHTLPCATIADCLLVLDNCCLGTPATILIQTNLTASGGNSNVKVDVSTSFPSLSIIGARPSLAWDLEDNGFALHVSASKPFKFSFGNLHIQRASESAVQIEGGDVVLFNVHLTALQFSECEATEGPAIYASFSGELVLEDVSIVDTLASSQCGGISIYARGRSTTSVAPGSTLSFVNTQSDGIGACMCLFMESSAAFMALYEPGNKGMISALSCKSKDEGVLYAEGGAVILSNIHAQSNSALSGGFFTGKDLAMLKVNAGIIQNTTVTEDGSTFALYNSNEVDITGVSITSCVAGSSGTIYLEGGQTGYLSELSVKLNRADQYGGAVLINGTHDITLTRSVFFGNEAYQGTAVACIDGSVNTEVTNVTMTGRGLSPFPSQEVWSDGSCASSFWNTPTVCPDGTCGSCSGSVCSDSSSLCECYCTGTKGQTCP